MLLQYPSSIIKLDRSLLTEMTESADKKNFIASIVYACHRFGKKVCMEGVETQVQDTLIKDAGCDTIQGYYYYRPMEVSSLYKLVSRGIKKVSTHIGLTLFLSIKRLFPIDGFDLQGKQVLEQTVLLPLGDLSKLQP